MTVQKRFGEAIAKFSRIGLKDVDKYTSVDLVVYAARCRDLEETLAYCSCRGVGKDRHLSERIIVYPQFVSAL